MVGVVVATHGRLGDELLMTTKFIVGATVNMVALSIDPARPVEELQADIKEAIGNVDQGEGVLILTDMFGGTPANMTLAFMEEGNVEIVTGVNLPMLIRLCQCRDGGQSLHEVADSVVEYGRKSISQACAILQS